ncbi:MAG: hypothetical protein E6I24_07850, partial [Chloroflexi bacterium]
MSFRLRLTVFGTALVAATLLAFGWLVYELVANNQGTTQDDGLKQRASDAAGVIARAAAGELNGSTNPTLSGAEDLRHRTDPFIEVLTASGTVVSSTGRIGDTVPAIPA